MNTTATYIPKNLVVVVGGVIINGFTDDDFFTVERNEDIFTTKVGANGDVVRSKSSNYTGIITLKLLQTSPVNLVLSELFKTYYPDQAGLEILSFAAKEGDFTVVYAAECWLKTTPKMNYGKEAGDREWVLEAKELQYTIGGT